MHSTYSKGFIHWKWILTEMKEWKAPLGTDFSLMQNGSCVIEVKVILKGNLLLLVNASTMRFPSFHPWEHKAKCDTNTKWIRGAFWVLSSIRGFI